jgi:hypothetical protein
MCTLQLLPRWLMHLQSKISKQKQTESDGTHDQQQQNGIIYNQKSSSSW